MLQHLAGDHDIVGFVGDRIMIGVRAAVGQLGAFGNVEGVPDLGVAAGQRLKLRTAAAGADLQDALVRTETTPGRISQRSVARSLS